MSPETNRTTTTLDARTVESPIGALTLIALGDVLVGLEFGGRRERAHLLSRHLQRTLGPLDLREHDDPAGAATRLARYFAGELNALEEQPVETYGTPFQHAVWSSLRLIHAGETWTYSKLAADVGRPKAVRAAGAANGANPIAIFVPCHRVIAADGTLWGYGGGLDRKRWLLAHEHARFVDPEAQGTLAFREPS